jgi:uncharacterized membrane protein
MIVLGRHVERNAPKKINSLYGYRTVMSMKNMDTWVFAHNYFGKLWKKYGIILFLISATLTALSYFFHEDVQGIICVFLVSVQTLIAAMPIFPVEKVLNKTFDKDGNRK